MNPHTITAFEMIGAGAVLAIIIVQSVKFFMRAETRKRRRG